MIRKFPARGALYAAAMSALAIVPGVYSQTAINSPATPAEKPIPVEKVADDSAVTRPEDDEVVVLSPFSILAAEDAGTYKAGATLAGSRIRTELRDVGSAISVVTAQFLKDTGAVNNQTLLQYTVGTEVGGTYGNFAGLGDTAALDDTNARLNPQSNTRVRGLSEADNTRDFFLTDIPWDSYNVGRVDVQRGPNAILFGMGAPAGIINTSIDGATFKRQGNLEVRLDNFGTFRSSAMYNHVLLPNELAIRVAGLNDETKYRQRPAYQHDKRAYVALRYDPRLLRTDNIRTSFEAKYERGNVQANRPRILPPGDLITGWWTDPVYSAIRKSGGINTQTVGLNNATVLANLRAAGDLAAGTRGNTSGYQNLMIGSFGRNYGGIVAVFDNPNSSAYHLMTTDISKSVTSTVTGIPWTIMSGLIPMKDRMGVVGASRGVANYDFYRNETLRDSDVGLFDFYNKLLDGPNKKEWSSHQAFNVKGTVTFFDNRFGIEGAFDKQTVERGQGNILSEFGQAITLDMNNTLPDGSKNPNFGKATVISDQFANNSFNSKRDSWRVTTFGEFRGSDIIDDSLWAKIVGKHVFTGLASSEDYKTEQRGWLRAAADAGWGTIIGDPLMTSRSVNTLNYLSTASIAGLGDYRAANITNLRANQYPSSGDMRYFDGTWTAASTVVRTDPWTNPNDPTGTYTQKDNPANYRGWVTRSMDVTTDLANRNALTTNAQLTRTITSSFAANWQGYFWDGVIVPSYGVRYDKQKAYSLNQGQVPLVAGGSRIVDLTSPLYRIPDVATPDNEVIGHTKTYSLVVHTPKGIQNKMWGKTGLSVYFNQSENFQPKAGRIDIFGASLSSPQGETRDFGILIETLNDRLTFRINHYKTTVTNARLEGFNGDYMTWGAESWAYDFGRANLLRVAAGGWADFTKGYDPLGIVANATPGGGWTPAQITQAQAAGDAIVNAYMANAPSAAWFKLWGIDTAAADRGEFTAGSAPTGFTVTGDTVSKGWEYELTAQPTRNWNITINAAKTSAERTNMAGSMVKWVEARWKVYNTPVNNADGTPLMLQIPVADGGPRQAIIGDLRFWNGGYGPSETLKGKYLREFMSGYWLYRIQEGSDVPELRPWRVNLVTNYNFERGMVKGLSVGGGYRWQDEVVVGYPVLPGATLDSPRSFDLGHPYKGPAEDAIDLWIGYTRKLSKKLEWRVQLNARNIFGKDKLIPITVQPDGTLAAGRIPEPTVYTFTNTLSF